MPEIGMCHTEGDLVFANGVDQVIGLFQVEAKRFLAEHRNSSLDGLHCRVEVHMIGSDNDDVVELLIFGQLCVGRDHLVIGAVTFDRVRPVGSLVQSYLRIRKKCGSSNTAGTVEMNSFLMWLDDKGTFAATDQTDIKGFLRHK